MTPRRIGPRQSPRRIRLAWYQVVVPHYRVAAINQVAERTTLDVTVFVRHPQAIEHDASKLVKAPLVVLKNAWERRRWLPFAYAHGWTRILRDRPDVIIVPEFTSDLVGWLLLATRRLFGARLVVMGHVRLTRHDKNSVALLRRWLVSSADGVIAYTQLGAQQALDWGLQPTAVIAMGNTIDVERITRARENVAPEQVARIRGELGLEHPVFLFVGRPTPWKRLDVAIETVRRLCERGVHACLLVIGAGNGLEEYVELARDLDTVHFLGRITDEEELAVYFAIAELVLIPGAVGLAVNHAFAYGLPLVTARGVQHGPEMEIAEHGRNAWLVDECDPERFADALAWLMESSDRLATLRQGITATEVPTMEAMASRITSLVTTLATRPERRPRD